MSSLSTIIRKNTGPRLKLERIPMPYYMLVRIEGALGGSMTALGISMISQINAPTWTWGEGMTGALAVIGGLWVVFKLIFNAATERSEVLTRLAEIRHALEADEAWKRSINDRLTRLESR